MASGTKVLLVDDEEEFVEALAERMTSRGIQVDTARDGKEAVDKQEEKDYDAIILDLSMPGMDGLETMKQLLLKNPDLQIILLTGHASLEKGVEAVKAGAVSFLEKPADLNKLMELIKEAKAQKMLLVEERMEEKMKELLRNRSW
ncbi:MAG: response regulator [Candidatus Riflebacteria bacterium]|nr:response regulator [Candidatus Riflebacteria bacterium]